MREEKKVEAYRMREEKMVEEKEKVEDQQGMEMKNSTDKLKHNRTAYAYKRQWLLRTELQCPFAVCCYTSLCLLSELLLYPLSIDD